MRSAFIVVLYMIILFTLCFVQQSHSSIRILSTISVIKMCICFPLLIVTNMHTHTHTHTHTTILQLSGLCPGQPWWAGTRRYIWPSSRFSGAERMKITQADAPTIRMDCHPIQTNWCAYLCHPHHFYTGCPSWHNPPNLSWLGTGTKYAGLHTQWLGLIKLSPN